MDVKEKLREYKRQGFGVWQLKEIEYGLREGLDISKYAKKEFDWMQMEEIRLGLESGVNVDIYAKPEFTSLQMREIRLGLEKGLDVSWYANPFFCFGQMREIRLGLEHRIDVYVYADPKFDQLQMEQIRLGLEEGLDASVYAEPKFQSGEMEEIRYKYKDKLSELFLLKKELEKEFGKERIKAINTKRIITLDHLKKFDINQLKEILLGALQGVDYIKYAKPELSWKEMEKIREELFYEKIKQEISKRPVRRVVISASEKNKEEKPLKFLGRKRIILLSTNQISSERENKAVNQASKKKKRRKFRV
jgi:hypothetical protein